MNTLDSSGSLSSAPRILVVDDNADAALILSMSLRLKGYPVQSVPSGQEALAVTQNWSPHAILLDISMPGMDGYETLSRLREQAGGQRVVIIAVTGYGQEEDRQRTRAAGFDGHWVKPVDLPLLPSLLLELMAQKKASPDWE